MKLVQRFSTKCKDKWSTKHLFKSKKEHTSVMTQQDDKEGGVSAYLTLQLYAGDLANG